jgi:ribosomal protein L11
VLLHHATPLADRIDNTGVQDKQVVKVVEHKVEKEPGLLVAYQLRVYKTRGEMVEHDTVIWLLRILKQN